MKYNSLLLNFSKNEDLFKNKLLVENLYGKFFIRNTASENEIKNVLVLDNNNDSFQIKIKEKKLLKNSLSGQSFYANKFLYKHKSKLMEFRFNSIIPKNSIQNSFLLEYLRGLKSLKKKHRFLILTTPAKGGFFCYSSGFTAFLPFKHLLKLFRHFFNPKKEVTHFKQNNFLNFFLNKENNLKFFILFRLPFFLGYFKMSAPLKKKSYSKSRVYKLKKKKSFYTTKSFCNLIFLIKRKKLKNFKKKS